MEIAFGPFERAIRIGIPFARDRVSAQLEDGFLRVTLPKRDTGPRRIDVETG
jgi:HSP20 family molecular chaperone IbpA